MGKFDFEDTLIEGLMCIQRRRLEDKRGYLSRLYCEEEYEMFGIKKSIAQINLTLTRRRGIVRGMHYQLPPYAEAKVVTCLHGEVFDVAVDLRKNSSTFLKWHAEVLSSENQRSLLIPEGFAHGFQTLTDDCELIYLHSVSYKPTSEAALNARDPRLAITWPLEITEMSSRDHDHPLLVDGYEGVEL